MQVSGDQWSKSVAEQKKQIKTKLLSVLIHMFINNTLFLLSSIIRLGKDNGYALKA